MSQQTIGCQTKSTEQQKRQPSWPLNFQRIYQLVESYSKANSTNILLMVMIGILMCVYVLFPIISYSYYDRRSVFELVFQLMSGPLTRIYFFGNSYITQQEMKKKNSRRSCTCIQFSNPGLEETLYYNYKYVGLLLIY